MKLISIHTLLLLSLYDRSRLNIFSEIHNEAFKNKGILLILIWFRRKIENDKANEVKIFTFRKSG